MLKLLRGLRDISEVYETFRAAGVPDEIWGHLCPRISAIRESLHLGMES
ncbi:MAG: hypothetical protein HW380_3117 [Magnetococcales bacterium]|nr:hypothetical protein [Magnetococcales bacterium]